MGAFSLCLLWMLLISAKAVDPKPFIYPREALAGYVRNNSSDGIRPGLAQEPTTAERAAASGELLRKVNLLLDSGSLADAEKQARVYVKEYPGSWEGHYLLGLILFKQGRAKESLAEYTEGAKYHEPGAEDLQRVALNYVLLGELGEADKWLTKAVEWNPQAVDAWYYLGRTKYNENRFAEAIAAFESCLRLDARNVKAKANLGLSFAALGKVAEAEAVYREAISWQADSPMKSAEPYIDLGDLLLDQNKTEEAIALLVQANAIPPEDPRVPELLGKAYMRQNRFQDARERLERAVQLAPEKSANHYLLGQVYRRQGMTEKAKLELERAAELSGSQLPKAAKP